MVLRTARVSRNYLKISHEITKISVLAGSLWDSTILPDYNIIKSRIRLFIWGFSSTCGTVRVRLQYSLLLFFLFVSHLICKINLSPRYIRCLNSTVGWRFRLSICWFGLTLFRLGFFGRPRTGGGASNAPPPSVS